jgi:hypothetical protein
MGEYTARLRYYAGDPLEEIRQEDLDRIAETFSVNASFEKIENRVLKDGLMQEETLDKTIEEMTQDVITIESDHEGRFRQAILAVYEKYRSPRTPYSLCGSSPKGERVAKAVAEETGGGW